MLYRRGAASDRVRMGYVERNRGPEAGPVEGAETDTPAGPAAENDRGAGTSLATGGLYPATGQTRVVALKAVTGWFRGKIAPPGSPGGLSAAQRPILGVVAGRSIAETGDQGRRRPGRGQSGVG